jgi:hypothetical protein
VSGLGLLPLNAWQPARSESRRRGRVKWMRIAMTAALGASRMPISTLLSGGTAPLVAWGALTAFFAAWLVFLAWREKEKPLWVRLVPFITVVASLLVLWGLARYGDALLHWIRS